MLASATQGGHNKKNYWLRSWYTNENLWWKNKSI